MCVYGGGGGRGSNQNGQDSNETLPTAYSPMFPLGVQMSFSVFSRTAARVTLFTNCCIFSTFYWNIHICPPIFYSV